MTNFITAVQEIEPVTLGDESFFTLEQIAEKFNIPMYFFVREARKGEFGSRKLGTTYIVSAYEFRLWVENGQLQYTRRRPKNYRKLANCDIIDKG